MPTSKKNNKRKSPLQHLIAGGCAGLVESSICHPLDTVKTMMQLQGNSTTTTNTKTTHSNPSRIRMDHPFGSRNRVVKKRELSTSASRFSSEMMNQHQKHQLSSKTTNIHGPIGTARRIVQQDGFFALYRGLSAVYTGIIPKMAIRFLTFEQYKEWLSVYTSLGRSTTSTTFTAGLFAGLTEAILVVTPAEVCKIRMQSESSSQKQLKNVFHAAYTIVRQEGIGALYKGIIPTMFRQGCNQAVNFTAYNWIKNRVLDQQGKQELASWQTLMIGGFSGGMGPIVNNPVSTTWPISRINPINAIIAHFKT